jgi:hypothetical protein
MSNNRLGVAVGSGILAIIIWAIGFAAMGPTMGRMVCVIVGLYVVGWGLGYYMETPEPDQRTKAEK